MERLENHGTARLEKRPPLGFDGPWAAIRLALRGVGLGKVSPADPDSAYGVGRRRGEVDVTTCSLPRSTTRSRSSRRWSAAWSGDSAMLSRKVHEQVPGSPFVRVEGAGHSTYFQRPHAFTRQGGGLLKEHRP
jgi:hypothetical protein